MKWPRYDAYKRSELNWVGQTPAHWSAKSLRRVTSIHLSNVDKKSVEGQEAVRLCNYTDVYYNDRIASTMEFMEATATTEQRRRFQVLVGDVLITKDSETADDIASPAVISEDLPRVLCGYHLALLRPGAELLGSYLARAISCSPVRDHFFASATGVTRFGLSRSDIANAVVPVPPVEEQASIAAFLDRETARLDGLIEKRRRMIELLQEKRAALITHAVTRGFDPDAPLKDSGIEWLGQIPTHWQVKRVKFAARLESGHTPSRQVSEYWDDCDISWVSLNDSKQLSSADYITETAVQISQLGLANSSARLLPAGAVVFTRDATIGLAAITTRPMAVSQHLIAWLPGPDVRALYLLRVFNAMKAFLDSFTFGATIKTIGMSDVKKLVAPIPPLAEQDAITNYLAGETTRLDALVDGVHQSIASLTEYRSSLITAAVTGQIDVRGLAP